VSNLSKKLAKLPFATKLKLLDLVRQKYPEFENKYPEFEGEVPLSWLLSEEEIEKLLKEIKAVKEFENDRRIETKKTT